MKQGFRVLFHPASLVQLGHDTPLPVLANLASATVMSTVVILGL